MEYLYHGSAEAGITALEARSKLHGTEQRVVYLTDSIPYALYYVWDAKRHRTPVKHVTGWVKDGVAYYEEQFPCQLERFYRGVPGWLYRTPKGPEAQAVRGREGLFCAPGDVPVEAEHIPDVYAALLGWEAEGRLKVLRYTEQTPERQAELTGLIADLLVQKNFFAGDRAQEDFMKTYFSRSWEEAARRPPQG